MFFTFFAELRAAKVPVTLREYLTLLEALEGDLADKRVEDFYYLSRACLVKDERNLDKFDRVFAHAFRGMETLAEALDKPEIPEEWLKRLAERYLTDEEKAQIQALGWDKLLETLQRAPQGAEGAPPGRLEMDRHRRHLPVRRLRLQPGRHAHRPGRQPQFPRRESVGQARVPATSTTASSSGCATCAWRCVAYGGLRARARRRSSTSTTTIRETAHKGYLDVKLRPERRNAVKVLLFLDVGGSMDWHVEKAEELFSAARSEFKHFEHFYFHNCLYERLWKENRRRHTETIPTLDVIRTYPGDYRVVFVGDASMSPYEIAVEGGSVEHWNEEPGRVWLERLMGHFPKAVWLNPVPESQWGTRRRSASCAACSAGACSRSRSTASTGPCASSCVKAAQAYRITSTEHLACRTMLAAFEPRR